MKGRNFERRSGDIVQQEQSNNGPVIKLNN